MTRRQRRSWGKIHRERSGRFQASYTGPDLARRSAPVTFTARMDAEHWLADERRLIEREEWTPPKLRAAAKHARSKTFHEYATGWLDTRDLKPRTRQGYQELLDKPLRSLHTLPPGMISAETVRRWHSGMGPGHPTPKQPD